MDTIVLYYLVYNTLKSKHTQTKAICAEAVCSFPNLYSFYPSVKVDKVCNIVGNGSCFS